MLSARRFQFYQQHAADFGDVLKEYQTVMHKWRLAAAFEPGTTMRGAPVYIYIDGALSTIH